MPRRRKDQAVQTSTGQAYGESGDLHAAQAQIPLPDVTAQRQAGAAAAPAPQGGAPPAPQPPPDRFAAALAAAQSMAPPTGTLGNQAASDQPLPTGRTADFWAQLADMTGDPSFLDLAVRARLAS